MRNGDYIVYVDESGDHNLVDFDPDYPRFVLTFCIFPIREYVDVVVPMVERVKFDHFGHDMVVLHEREIRRAKRPFDILLDPHTRASFMARLDQLVTVPRFGIVATVIRKPEFRERQGLDISPYAVALEFGLERVFLQLQSRNQVGRRTWIVFEGRGRTEDAELELQFGRIMRTSRMHGMRETLSFLSARSSRTTLGTCSSRSW